jgi:hypothetical protein
VIDLELQARFWRSFTDAMLHGTQASLAAAAAWQDQALASSASAGSKTPAPAPALAAWPWMAAFEPVSNPWQMWPQTPSHAAPTPFPVMMPDQMSAMMPWTGMFWQTASAFGPNSQMMQMVKSMTPFWPWPEMTWAYMQMPLTAMLVSSGMPYSVASPSAKASTAAMDAADAVREQMDKVYAAYRSDGGHAAAQIAVLPWTLAASFMDSSTKPAS